MDNKDNKEFGSIGALKPFGLMEGGKVMKSLAKKLSLVLLAIAVLLTSGCIWYEEEDDHHDVCCTGPYEEYWPLLVEGWPSASNELQIDGSCPPGGCGILETSSYDTVILDGYWDYELIQADFNFTLTNWGSCDTYVWVDVCWWDYYTGDYVCEYVVGSGSGGYDLWGGEVLWDRTWSTALDDMMMEFDDCYFLYGDFCTLYYDIDVYLTKEDTCSTVTLDYYYDGLYLYY